MIENSGDYSTDESSNSTVFVVKGEPRQPWKLPVIEYFNLKYSMAGPIVLNHPADMTGGSS
jgi:hypothetical protein